MRAFEVAADAVRQRGLLAYAARFVAAQALCRWEAGDADAVRALDEALADLARTGDLAWSLPCRAARALACSDRELSTLEDLASDAQRLQGAIGQYARTIALLAQLIEHGESADLEPVVGARYPDPRVRVFQRMLRRQRAGALPHQEADLVLRRRDQSVTWRGVRVDLRRRPVLAGILFALAEANLVAPDRGLSVAELIRAAWPSQRIREEAAKNRLRVAIHELRKVGLREVVKTTDDGYRIAPCVRRVDIA
jgi:DNA-binding winged helix-turn-helix (wHTH) protein